MDIQLRRVLNDYIIWEQMDSKGIRGSLTFKEPIKIPCYIAGGIELIRDIRGEEVTSTMAVYIDGKVAKEHPIGYDDKITLKDGRNPPILAIIPYIDRKGKLYSVELRL